MTYPDLVATSSSTLKESFTERFVTPEMIIAHPNLLMDGQNTSQGVDFELLDKGFALAPMGSFEDQSSSICNYLDAEAERATQCYTYGTNNTNSELLPPYLSFLEPAAHGYGTITQSSESEPSIDMSMNISLSQPESLASLWSTLSDRCEPGASFCTGPFHENTKVAEVRKSSLRRHQEPSNGISKKGSLVKKKARSGEPRLRKAIGNLEDLLRSHPTFSPYSKQKSKILLGQIKLLTDEEELRGMLPATPPPISSHKHHPLRDISSHPRSTISSNSISYRQNDYQKSLEIPQSTSHETCDQTTRSNETLCELRPTYECTKVGCNYSTISEVDWRRHETGDKHWPLERFICLQCPVADFDLDGDPICPFCSKSFFLSSDLQEHYLQCAAARHEGRTFGRKDHFCLHLRKEHDIQDTGQQAANWKYPIYSDWPRECGFCGAFFQCWGDRMKHIALHYQKGRRIKDWKVPFPQSKHPNSGSRRPGPDAWNDDSDDDDDFDGGGGKLHNLATGIIRRGFDTTRYQPETVESDRQYEHGWKYQQTRSLDSNRETRSICLMDIRSLDDAGGHRYMRLNPSLLPSGGIWPPLRSETPFNMNPQPTKEGKHKIILTLQVRCLLGSPKAQLAKNYVSKYNSDLPGGIFWMDSNLPSGVKGSFWNIACRFVLGKDGADADAVSLGFINHWRRKDQQTLLGRSGLPNFCKMVGLTKACRYFTRGHASHASCAPVASGVKWKSVSHYPAIQKSYNKVPPPSNQEFASNKAVREDTAGDNPPGPIMVAT